MKTYFKIIIMAVLGGLVSGLIRLVTYLMYKTPAIEFDGPAGYSFVLAIIGGGLLFATAGIVLVVKRKL